MNVLGLDCATHTGWSLWKDGKLNASGVEDFSKKRGESGGSMYLRVRKWLLDFVTNNEVKFVAYEQAHHRGGAATEICVNLTGRVQEVCAEKSVEYATIHTASLKKFAVGAGKASKEDMMAAATKLLGRPITSDDEADAIFIGKWAMETYGK
jgi:Holliday junction resolvasome RuvABC endonuclease subunit